MKFCKDCKHCQKSFIDPFHYNFATCKLFQFNQESYIDLVSGETRYKKGTGNYCKDLREDLEPCGPQARYFEAK